MSRLFVKLTLLSLVVVLSLLCACSDNGTGPGSNRFEATEQFSTSMSGSGLTGLSVEGINGDIKITAVYEATSVKIEALKIVRSESTADAQDHLQLLHVEVLVSGSTVNVRTTQPKSPDGRDYIVNYEITVPRDFAATVTSVNGEVALNSLRNAVSVSIVNGQAGLSEIHGSATVSVVNGRIDGDVTLPFNGSAIMSIVNGGIDLDIPQTTSAEFSASITNGTIDVSNLTLQNQHTTSHSVVGTLGDGDGTIALAVTNGTIDVTGF